MGMNLVPSSFLRAFGSKREEAVGGWKMEKSSTFWDILQCSPLYPRR
jgi:hypothetical protein